MKAAIIHQFGEVPHYSDFPDPVATEGETLVNVRAAVLENFDKITASGKHYGSRTLFPRFPAIAGTDGAGLTADGRSVVFGKIRPPYGAFAEKAAAGYVLPIPEGVDAIHAAAMPSAVLTSLLPLKYTAGLQEGETVLVNGATGVSGRIAIQLARLLGAGRVVGTGRNPASLRLLESLGADAAIDISQPEALVKDALAAAAGEGSYDIVVDFLWGRPAELLLETFTPHSVGFPTHRVRYIQVGEKAGKTMTLPAAALRTSGVVLQGVGPLPPEALASEMAAVWEWIKEDRFYMDIEEVPLARVGEAWQRNDLAGKRLVLVP